MLLLRGNFYGVTYTLKDFSLPRGKGTRFSFKPLTPTLNFAQRFTFELLNRIPGNLDTRGTRHSFFPGRGESAGKKITDLPFLLSAAQSREQAIPPGRTAISPQSAAFQPWIGASSPSYLAQSMSGVGVFWFTNELQEELRGR